MINTVGLVGNQNSGKTTLFNAFTGSNQKVGNWPGVTIERKEGRIKGTNITIVDLPGIYSLSPYSLEENVSRNFVLNDHPDLIVNIVDATQLERSLYLTTQLLELDTDVVVALNMCDLVEKEDIHINTEKLSEALGVTVVRISAKTGEGIKELIDIINSESYIKGEKPKIYPKDFEHAISNMSLTYDGDNKRFACVKFVEGDPLFVESRTDNDVKAIEAMESKYDMDGEQLVASLRYDFIDGLKAANIFQDRQHREKSSMSEKLDRIFLNKWAAIPIFLVIMLLVYLLSVGLVGGLTVGFVDALFNGTTEIEFNVFAFGDLTWVVPWEIEGLGPLLARVLADAGASEWACSMVADGIVAGVGAVCNFIPQVAIMFLCLTLLETCGYMSRIAFFLDRIFHKFGLSGRSIIPFVCGMGCSVPAIMSTRTIEDSKEREAAVFLTPFMPCSAKLPIISVFASFFFAEVAWLVSFSFYVFAIVVILLCALLYKVLFNKGGDSGTFISELPDYKAPVASYVFRDVGYKIWAFIKRAGTIILLCSVVIWVMVSFTWDAQYINAEGSNLTIDNSILASIGNVFAWLFYPMLGGTWSWEATVSAIQGLVAKEQVVSSMEVIAGVEEGSLDMFAPGATFGFFNGWTAYGYMTFTLFSAPCFGAIGAMRAELGSTKKMFAAVGFQTGLAWLLGTLIGCVGWVVAAVA